MVRDEQLHQVMLPNGTFKTTWRHRLDDVNEFSLPFIRGLSGPLRIMDVAASSGSTTAEWRDQLSRSGIEFAITATDKAPFAYRLKIGPGITALVDSNRNPLYFTLFGHGVSPRIKGLKAPAKLFLRAILKANRSPLSAKIQLTDDLPVVEDDLLSPNRADWVGAFHVIRAANILNRAYFNDASIRHILTVLRERLNPDGLLIVVRTREDDNRNDASIIRGSEVIARLNGGSEIEDLIRRSND